MKTNKWIVYATGLIAGIFLLCESAFASWTFSEEFEYRIVRPGTNFVDAAAIKITATSDGADPSAQALGSSMIKGIEGMYLMHVVTDVGAGAAAPDVTFDVSFTDGSGYEFLLVDEHSNSEADYTSGDDKIGIPFKIGNELNYDFDDIGAANDIVYMWLYFSR